MTAAERFAANLKGARAAAGLSQEQLSYVAELHRTQISLLESGTRIPHVPTLLKLAGALRIPVADLLAGIEWKPGQFTYGEVVVREDA